MTRRKPDLPESSAARLRVTHGRILGLALPMMVSHVTTPLLGFIGTAVIGRLDDPAQLGAMALGAVLFDFLFWTFGSLRMATAGLTAQAVGRSSHAAIDETVARAILAGIAFGAVMIVLQKPIIAVALTLAGASSATSAALARYIAIRIIAAPFTLANYAILGSTMGRGRTDLGLAIQVAINVVNAGLTAFLVLGARLEIAGAALATLMAEATGFALGLAILHRLGSRLFAVPRAALLDRDALRRTAAVNGNVMIRTAALMAAFSIFAALGARAGDTTLAANAVLQNIFLTGSFMLDGFATAAETLCGQAFGAGDVAAFRRVVRLSLAWCLGFGGVVATGFLLAGRMLIEMITTSAPVRDLALQFLPYAALTPLAGAAAFAFDGIYVGATWTRAMRDLMLIALAVYLVLLVVLQGTGNVRLWIALLAFLALRSIGQALLLPRLVRGSFGADVAEQESKRRACG